jgi:Zn-dependent protease with chaperone function
MSAESAAIQAPEPTESRSPFAGQVDVAQLDDKRLATYRHPNEIRALAAIVVGLAIIVAVLWLGRETLGGLLEVMPAPMLRFLSQWVQPTRLGLVLVCLLALMAVMDIIGQSSRAWQLVAQAVEVTPATFPQLAPIVDDLRTRFDLPRTRVYVSRDAPVTGYTIGVREPFAIVFSSIGVGQLTPEEFTFALGREMGSIKLGHTVMATLLGNVRMSLPQPFSMLLKFRSVLFGSYHHAQALSCDRIGVVATRNVTPAISTLIKQNLGQVRGAKIDIKSLTPQTAELGQGNSGRVLRLTMLLNAQPYALARLAELVSWAGEPASAMAEPAATP